MIGIGKRNNITAFFQKCSRLVKFFFEKQLTFGQTPIVTNPTFDNLHIEKQSVTQLPSANLCKNAKAFSLSKISCTF